MPLLLQFREVSYSLGRSHSVTQQNVLGINFTIISGWSVELTLEANLETLVAPHRTIRLRFGYGFASCDANGPRNVKNQNLANQKPVFLSPLRPFGSQASVLKVPKRGKFRAAIRVTPKRCDSCAQVLYRETDGIAAKLLQCGVARLAKRYGETCHTKLYKPWSEPKTCHK